MAGVPARMVSLPAAASREPSARPGWGSGAAVKVTAASWRRDPGCRMDGAAFSVSLPKVGGDASSAFQDDGAAARASPDRCSVSGQPGVAEKSGGSEGCSVALVPGVPGGAAWRGALEGVPDPALLRSGCSAMPSRRAGKPAASETAPVAGPSRAAASAAGTCTRRPAEKQASGENAGTTRSVQMGDQRGASRFQGVAVARRGKKAPPDAARARILPRAAPSRIPYRPAPPGFERFRPDFPCGPRVARFPEEWTP